MKPNFNSDHPYWGRLLENKRLTDSNWNQDVRHYRIQLDSSMQFSPGDALAILPCNPQDLTLQLLARLNLDPQMQINSLTPTNQKYRGPKSLSAVPLPITLEELFRCYLDIQKPPRRYFFKLLSYFTEAAHEKERLEYFSTSEAQVIVLIIEPFV